MLFPVEVCRELTPHQQTKIVPAGTLLLEQGTAPIHLMIINEGQVEISVNSGRKTVPLTIVGKGKVLGLRAIVSGEVTEKNAVTLEDCTITFLPRRTFSDVLERHPEIYFAVASVLSADLKIAQDLLRQIPRRDRRGSRRRRPQEQVLGSFIVGPR